MTAGMRIVDRAAEGLKLLEEAQPLAEAEQLTVDLSRLHHLRGNLLFGMGSIKQCRSEHERALELARQAGAVEAEAAALGGVGDALYAQGRVRSALGMFNRCLELARENGFLRVEVPYLTMIAWCSLYLMDVPGALRASGAALELAQRVSHRRSEMMANAQTALLDGWYRGQVSAALPHLDAALELARGLGSYRFEAMSWMFRALVALRSGDRPAAREHAMTALRISGDASSHFIGPQLYAVLARIETDPRAVRQALAKGEAMLGPGAVSHSYFLLYEAGIQASLELGEWNAAGRYCGLLEAYCAGEPFAWAQFIVARGHALCRAGRGEVGADLLAELGSLRQQAAGAEIFSSLPELDSAIERLTT